MGGADGADGGIIMNDIDIRTLVLLGASLFSVFAGGFFAHKAKTTEKFAFLVISVIFAVICLVGILLAVLSMIFGKS